MDCHQISNSNKKVNQNESKRFFREMKKLYTHMSREWVRVKWITLTEPNGTPMGKAWENYQKFLWEMTKHYGTHFHWVMGGDFGENSHAHIICGVPKDEEERFWRLDKTFKSYKHWKFKNLWFKDFQEGFKTEGYACEKHDHKRMPESVKCPKRREPCKKGRCTHGIVVR